MGRQLIAGVVRSAALRAIKAPLERSKQSNPIGMDCAKAAGEASRAAPPKANAERKRSEEVIFRRCEVAPVGYEFSISVWIGLCDELNHRVL